jgi:hypothetical protein
VNKRINIGAKTMEIGTNKVVLVNINNPKPRKKYTKDR